MSHQNLIRLKTPINLNKINISSQYKEKFNESKKFKLKPNFRHYQNMLNKKKFTFHRPNFHHSFMNSSAPFNYYKNPADKNMYLICYNGGPKVFSFLNKKDSEDELSNSSNNKEMIYNKIKSCGCPSKQNIPKFPRNLSYIENYRYNKNGKNKNQFNTYEKIKYLTPCSLSRNTQNFIRYRTAEPQRRTNDGKIIYTLKKFINKNDGKSVSNLRYENGENDENNKKKRILENNRNISCYAFRPRVNKVFHRNQIFDHCKPYLTDDFQEFPD